MKAFKWFPFALLFLMVDWWKVALAGVAACAVVGGVYAAGSGGSWLLAGLAGGGIGVAVALALWLLSALVMSYRARNDNWRMF